MLPRKKLIKPISVDERGEIINVLEDKIASVLVIYSKKGSVRSNHYHKKDAHYLYVLSGKIKYSHKNMAQAKSKKMSMMLKAGELIYTPPMVAHAVEFLENSVLLALTTKSRQQRAYESDTVRINFV